MNETLMNRLTWMEYQERVRDDQAPVFLPVGALEQHGPHLPLGTDAILSAAVAQGVAGVTSGLVAPALAWLQIAAEVRRRPALSRHDQPRRDDPCAHGAGYRA